MIGSIWFNLVQYDLVHVQPTNQLILYIELNLNNWEVVWTSNKQTNIKKTVTELTEIGELLKSILECRASVSPQDTRDLIQNHKTNIQQTMTRQQADEKPSINILEIDRFHHKEATIAFIFRCTRLGTWHLSPSDNNGNSHSSWLRWIITKSIMMN
jgi:hypothetical protein